MIEEIKTKSKEFQMASKGLQIWAGHTVFKQYLILIGAATNDHNINAIYFFDFVKRCWYQSKQVESFSRHY